MPARLVGRGRSRGERPVTAAGKQTSGPMGRMLRDVEPPESVGAEKEILNKRVMEKFFPDAKELPDGSALYDNGYRNSDDSLGTRLKGIHFSGLVRAGVLESIAARFPALERVHFHDSQEPFELHPLRSLSGLRSLTLKNLRAVRARDLEKLLHHTEIKWPHLRKLHLIGMAVTDEALQGLPKMPCLEDLDLSDSYITRRGLLQIWQTCPRLKKLNVTGCFCLDALSCTEFQARRPGVDLQTSPPDPRTLTLASEEAKQYKKASFTLPHKGDKRKSYSLICALIGHRIPKKPDYPLLNRLIESYMGVHRMAGAIFAEWVRQGVFNPPEELKQPRSVVGVVALFNDAVVPPIRRLNFEALELRFVPICFRSPNGYEKLEELVLKGAFLDTLPAAFKESPLRRIEWRNHTEERG
ncbi:MAG TPA: hypothetical protein VLF94_01440 [Chlamydiales bacterium]|nr:hypothetical protein [Chlamydiales bacterium]